MWTLLDGGFWAFVVEHVQSFWQMTGIYGLTWGHVVMLAVGCFFLYLGIAKQFEPLLLVPIAFGILLGNIPIKERNHIGI